ncbi:MAG: hypothetical protein A2148_03440 [Chloroflexi bacterium RBG_16_68_14]|nr:MAG: hypothetical protein A2148_03440 [Chloroflexi bacterium RBG_16_68_14]
MTRVTQAHIDARKEDILDAAMGMFARKGVAGTTMQEIAGEAHLSAGAIYRYYPSKEDLLRAVCGVTVDHVREMFAQAAASAHSPLEAIDEVGRSAWSEFKSEGCQEHLILNLEATLAAARQLKELGAERREMLNAIIEMLGRLIRQAQAAEQIDDGVDSRALASLLLACHLGSGLLTIELEDDVDSDAILRVVTQMLHRLAPVANGDAGRT